MECFDTRNFFEETGTYFVSYDTYISRVKKVFLFSYGQIMVFDEFDNQISEIQVLFTNEINLGFRRSVLEKIAEKAEEFYIGRWNEWLHKITKEEFLRICFLK